MTDPHNSQDHGRSLEGAGRFAEAIEVYRGLAADEQAPERLGLLWNRIGDLYARLDSLEEAGAAYERAAEAFAEAGLDNIALALLDRLLRVVPGHPGAHLRAARIAAARRFLDDARAHYLAEAEDARAAGDEARARAAEQELEQLRAAPSSPAAPADTGRPAEGAAGPTNAGAAQAPPEAEPEGGTLGLMPTSLAGPDEQQREHDAEPVGRLEGLEPTHALEAPPEEQPARGGPDPTDAPEAGAPPGAGAEPLPLLAWDDPAVDEDVAAARAPEPPEPESTERELRRRLREDPSDWPAWEQLLELLEREGDTAALRAALAGAAEACAADERFARAAELVRRLDAAGGGDLEWLQRAVEFAFRAGDRELLIGAYLGLAAQLARQQEAEQARAVYGKVLEIDADNAVARAALREAERAPGPPSRPEGGAAGVHLGDLILGESRGRETRFVLESAELEGDAERDFARILSAFRQNVAQEVDAGDAATHLDLGVAFKEMGLLDAAIRQLQAAVRAGADLLAALELLGECFVLKRQFDVAAEVLARATRLPDVGDEDLIGSYYWLGRCGEASGRSDDARDFYRRVVAHDVSFRDAAQRLGRL